MFCFWQKVFYLTEFVGNQVMPLLSQLRIRINFIGFLNIAKKICSDVGSLQWMSAVKTKTSEGVRIPQQVSFTSPLMSFGNRHGACSSAEILSHFLSWFALQYLDIPTKGWVRSSDWDYSCWGLKHDVGFLSPPLILSSPRMMKLFYTVDKILFIYTIFSSTHHHLNC